MREPIEIKKIRVVKNPNYDCVCVECGTKFQSNRRTAKYCSAYCKKHSTHKKQIKETDSLFNGIVNWAQTRVFFPTGKEYKESISNIDKYDERLKSFVDDELYPMVKGFNEHSLQEFIDELQGGACTVCRHPFHYKPEEKEMITKEISKYLVDRFKKDGKTIYLK